MTLVNAIPWFLGEKASIDGGMTLTRERSRPSHANASREKTYASASPRYSGHGPGRRPPGAPAGRGGGVSDTTQPRVLVAYASKHDSTAEIAQRIASAMREAGCDAQALPAAEVGDVSGYRAVVLGSAVYARRWQRGARSFARRHAAVLRTMPVWLFSSGSVRLRR